jgi:hypothetical protein
VDRKLAIVALLSGGCVAAILAPKDAYFIPNVLFFWLPQLAVRKHSAIPVVPGLS